MFYLNEYSAVEGSTLHNKKTNPGVNRIPQAEWSQIAFHLQLEIVTIVPTRFS